MASIALKLTTTAILYTGERYGVIHASMNRLIALKCTNTVTILALEAGLTILALK